MAESYQYRTTYRGSRKVSADIVATELAQLRATGEITATRVVEIAAPKDAPLHPAFEWDDRAAAQEFRLEQARRLVRAITVVPVNVGEDRHPPSSLVVHVPDPDGREGKYEMLSLVAENIDEYGRALTEAKRYLDSAEHRFHELRRLAEQRGGRTEALAIAVQGFAAVREAIELLR